jgi:hypothetical protein
MVGEEQAGCARCNPRRLSGISGSVVASTGRWREVENGSLPRFAVSVPIKGPVPHLLPGAR